MAQILGVSSQYSISFFGTNRFGSLVDSFGLPRSQNNPTPVFVNYPEPTTPNGESWITVYAFTASEVFTIDLTSLPYPVGASSITKVFTGITVVHFQSLDTPTAAYSVDISVPANGFVGPWGSGGFTLGMGGDFFSSSPGNPWPVDATHNFITITAPAVPVNFGICLVGTRA